MNEPKLFMVLLGANPPGRNIEQHDIFFGIAENLAALKEEMLAFWPAAKGNLHIDVWREVTQVAGYKVAVVAKMEAVENEQQLFFVNLGGYTSGIFDEQHYKVLVAAEDKKSALKLAKQTTFFKTVSGPGKAAAAHIDEKFGIDVDDFFNIDDILSSTTKEKFQLQIIANEGEEDEIQLGYIPFRKLI